MIYNTLCTLHWKGLQRNDGLIHHAPPVSVALIYYTATASWRMLKSNLALTILVTHIYILHIYILYIYVV